MARDQVTFFLSSVAVGTSERASNVKPVYSPRDLVTMFSAFPEVGASSESTPEGLFDVDSN
jgi:hypothetical protein